MKHESKLNNGVVIDGMFDILHNGHLDFINQAYTLFNEVYVIVWNPPGGHKEKSSFLTANERASLINKWAEAEQKDITTKLVYGYGNDKGIYTSNEFIKSTKIDLRDKRYVLGVTIKPGVALETHISRLRSVGGNLLLNKIGVVFFLPTFNPLLSSTYIKNILIKKHKAENYSDYYYKALDDLFVGDIIPKQTYSFLNNPCMMKRLILHESELERRLKEMS